MSKFYQQLTEAFNEAEEETLEAISTYITDVVVAHARNGSGRMIQLHKDKVSKSIPFRAIENYLTKEGVDFTMDASKNVITFTLGD